MVENSEDSCKLRGVTDVASVIPLRLNGGAFAVYLQLDEDFRKSKEEVKEALLAVFAVNPNEAYELFIAKRLRAGESPDIYIFWRPSSAE